MKRMIRCSMLSLLIALPVLTLPGPAAGQFARSEDAIRYRQSALFITGQHFSRIGAMVSDKLPFDAEVAKASARRVQFLTTLPWPAFTPGSESGGNTKASPDIWMQPEVFEAAWKRLLDTTPKLVAAADSGDKGQLKTAFGAVAAACKNCHDSFRER